MATIKSIMSVLVMSICICHIANAAVPELKVEPPLKILDSLNAPMRIAVEQIYAQGPQGYKDLYQVSFSSRYPMNTRWKAFMVMVRIGGEKSRPEIDKALGSGEWFMRSAGLLALEKVNQQEAVKEAKKKFAKDKALMVRAQALEILRNSPSADVKKLMWDKLYAKENYHRNRSLWIRKKIVGYLSDYASKAELKRFKKLFKDPDPEIVEAAFPAFERLLGKKASQGLSPSGQVAFWQNELKSI